VTFVLKERNHFHYFIQQIEIRLNQCNPAAKYMSYTLSDFDYDLPDEFIAQEPAQPRDHARLLVYNRATGTITEAVNDTTVRAMVRPGKKFKKGKTAQLTDDISAKVTDIDEEGFRTLELSPSLNDPVYNQHKHTPFPPYIEQNESLSEEYQTVYAQDLGSKAAPTAGLHFTDELLENITAQGITQSEVTLHVGLGTFAPVKAETIEEHTMHSEWFEITEDTADELKNADHITAVGTTSVRVLESCLRNHDQFAATEMNTDIFIRPGFEFKATDALITNFHLPKSTLLMLVAAFTGYEEMKKLYQHAIDEEYRFYSFGDAMLIL